MLSSGTGALAAAFRCTFMILGKKVVKDTYPATVVMNKLTSMAESQ